MLHTSRRVLITGGAGFIGSHLAELLVEAGDRVTAIDDLSTGSVDNVRALLGHEPASTAGGSFVFEHASVFDDTVLDPLVAQSDLVVHLAAAVGVSLVIDDPVQAIETNILGTREVLRAARRYGTKVMIASTSEVYGKNDEAPFHEGADCVLGATTTARWSYAASKAIDEVLGLAYHRQYDLPVVIFRLFNTIGPRQTGDYGMVVPRFVRQALAGEPLTVFGDGLQTRCFCDVGDTVRALAGLAEAPSAVGAVFNIGSTAEIAIGELADLVLRLVDEEGSGAAADAVASARTVRVPYEVAYERGFEDMRRRVPDITRIRETTGWQPRIPLAETLRRVIRHTAARGRAPAKVMELRHRT